MDVLLFSTTDMQAGRDALRDRMLASLLDTERSLGGAQLTLHLLLQNCGDDELRAFAGSAPAFVRPVGVPGRVPLSTARNLMLRPLLTQRAIRPDALIGFPDDDCWYPAGFLRQVVALFQGDATLGLWFCRYGSQPLETRFAETAPRSARMSEVVRNASSNTLFLRGRVVDAVGEFDETLGIGTPLGGAEDLDYALRAHRVAGKTAYGAAVLVGHRDKSPETRVRYYTSSLIVLARHARHGTWRELLRKVAIGVYHTLRGELGCATFAAALRRASCGAIRSEAGSPRGRHAKDAAVRMK
jgi:hypothetical protein